MVVLPTEMDVNDRSQFLLDFSLVFVDKSINSVTMLWYVYVFFRIVLFFVD